MDLQLNGKTALVTGATAGIGLAIARTLAKEGAKVAITGRGQDKLDAAAAQIGSAAPGATVTTLVADLATAEGAQALTAALPDTDILVNNLGYYEAKPFAEIRDVDWERMLELNLMSGVRLARHYFPRLLEKNWGRLIFISSEVGAFTPPDMIHYGVSKSAQLAVSRGLAELTRGSGVTVNSVLPGYHATDRLTGIYDDDAMGQLAGSVPARTIGDPADFGKVCAFLCSEPARYITGDALLVDGGVYAGLM